MTYSSSLSLWVYGALIFIGSNSLCVTHWKLDKDNNKVVPIETKLTPKHLAAGGSFLDDKQASRDDNEEIISTLKQRYGRVVDGDNVLVPTNTPVMPNTNDKCSVFPCDKIDDIDKEIDIKENKIDYEISDRTLSRSDSVEESDTEVILEQPDYEKKVQKQPWKSPATAKGNE